MGKSVRNIGIFAHVDAGKTTLTEHLLYACGAIRAVGSVDDGTAQTDYLDIERARGISVRSAQTCLSYRESEIHLLDTPGHFDFAGEAERCLLALDAAVLVVSAVEGVQAHTENLWRALSACALPRIVFLNKLDRTGSDSQAVLAEMRRSLGAFLLPLNAVKKEGDARCEVGPCESWDEEACEILAEHDDELAERWLEGEKIAHDELLRAARRQIADGVVTPVVFGCAKLGLGVEALLDAVTDLLPDAHAYAQRALSGVVYKVEHEPGQGTVAHVRLFGGSLHPRDALSLRSLSGDAREEEKISIIRRFEGKRALDLSFIEAGDIAALYGLSHARVGDVFGDDPPDRGFELANPFFRVKAEPENPEELPKLVSALRELSEEEPLLAASWENTEREIDLNITGRIQLEVLSVLLSERYGLAARFSPPTVIYKETPASVAEGFAAYTMPKPCWAIVRFLFEPLPTGSGVVYDPGRVPHNELFYKYQEHIRTSFFDCIKQGQMGWEVTDFRCTLIGGGHHTIHTHPLDFFVATPMAFANGLVAAGEKLLEPFIYVRIRAQEEIMGKVIADILAMRGEFDSPVLSSGTFTIECRLPVAESMEYPARLASLSGGRASFYSRFDSYRLCPPGIGKAAPYRGVNPTDRARWILYKRGAYTQN
ncbi:MAG: TetM/TetW/TetO/TetS family tetracycline resistance ribosomal protection protein [Oscillospiraceae bacterium]|nr:TetM/TetW/TetO/TetS family tetracycline resistance ribosomal protection protein [Oscillospiraceae bacterium]